MMKEFIKVFIYIEEKSINNEEQNMIETNQCNRKVITNDDKTLEIISEEEIKRYDNMTRNEAMIPFSTLEDALNIFESLGCGYHDIRLMSYYCLSDKGFLLIAENGKFGIKLKEKQKK